MHLDRNSARSLHWTIGALAAAALGLLPSAIAEACRYSVREVAFAELASLHYTLRVAPGERAGDGGLEAFGKELDRRFRHSGVVCEVAPGAAGPACGASAVLLSPDGRRLAIEAPEGSALAPYLADAVLGSPGQEALREAMPEHLCAVVIVHGTDEAATARLKDMAAVAARQVKAQLPTLERPIDRGAVIVEIPADRFQRERVLLWSLGLDTERPPVEPRIAAVFGRGRRFGPVMDPSGLDARTLADLLCLAGASCECGLDRSWMQGPVVPLAWTRQDQARISEALGFDPDSPLVALEMRQILAQAGASGSQGEAPLADIPASGYREFSLASLTAPPGEADASQALQAVQPPGVQLPADGGAPPASAAAQEAGLPQEGGRRAPWRNSAVWSVLAAIVLVNAVGGFRLWRRRHGAVNQ